ncbi:DNA methyltransferase [Edaphobacter bradus]|uniref:DNA methyltransferase n=1 Tax=Edaphobacter bradus TaxID=2259016 RepID=UPI0021E00AF6|nr:DNA methyltransferase [Edaphobacter bradus]
MLISTRMPPTANHPKNKLYYGDNLQVLQYIPDQSVDLIYLDPPFNSSQDYNVLFAEKDGTRSASQITAFKDTWEWNEEAARSYEEVIEQGGRVADAMRAFRTLLGGSDMLAYLAMMAPRLVELRRVLKETGSIYLHCDPTASHYLKLLLDGCFGAENFRSEIIWRRSSGHNKLSRQFGPIHDTILFYAKSDASYFRPGVRPVSRGYVREWFTNEDEGGPFRTNMLTGPGVRTKDSGKPWNGFDPTTVGRHWAIPLSLKPLLPEEAAEWTTQRKLDFLNDAGMIYIPRNGMGQPKYKQYLGSGIPYQDIWACQPYTEGTLFGTEESIDADVKWLGHEAEKLGYDTQKPEGLLERILNSSSQEGDVVLDPFCGCGTTVQVAQKLNRRWIGIDITHLAVGLIKTRLDDSFTPEIRKTYEVIGEPTDVAGAQQLASENKFQFQAWALGLVGARVADSDKRGADRGVDGRKNFHDDNTGKTKQIIFSVKGGQSVEDSELRDLAGTLAAESADIGAFISLAEPTKPMRKRAAEAGFYTSSDGTKYPRLQLLTIKGLLEGTQRLERPLHVREVTFKKAPRSRPEVAANLTLNLTGDPGE